MEMPIRISPESYVLMEPDLHDGALLGIALPADGRVEIAVADASGKLFCISLTAVTIFHASDFWEGNIILDLTVMRGTQVGPNELTELRSRLRDEDIRRALESVARDSLFVVQLNTSYGCHFVAIAGEIHLQPMGTPPRWSET